MKLSVFHTPELTPNQNLADCAIAIDVLRATSTMATALEVGAEAVQVFSDLDKLLHESEAWQPSARLRAGERGGQKVEGFDFGNSPLECTPKLMAGRRLFISTTNGTRALQKVEASPTVLAAALINRQAIVDHLLAHRPETVWIVGAGWEGSFALEDTVCAGAIADRLMQELDCSLADIAGNDELVGAVTLFQHWQKNLLELFYQSSHGQRLSRINGQADLQYCAQLDILNVLPIQQDIGVFVKA